MVISISEIKRNTWKRVRPIVLKISSNDGSGFFIEMRCAWWRKSWRWARRTGSRWRKDAICIWKTVGREIWERGQSGISWRYGCQREERQMWSGMQHREGFLSMRWWRFSSKKQWGWLRRNGSGQSKLLKGMHKTKCLFLRWLIPIRWKHPILTENTKIAGIHMDCYKSSRHKKQTPS